jgi:hypothetical protein
MVGGGIGQAIGGWIGGLFDPPRSSAKQFDALWDFGTGMIVGVGTNVVVKPSLTFVYVKIIVIFK